MSVERAADVGFLGETPVQSSQARPSVSIVIPAYMSAHTIEGCLESLDSQKYPRERYEIIVVDSGNDETQRICERRKVCYYRSPTKLSAGAARNVGAEIANGEIIAFIDADCIAPDQWLSHLLKDFDDLSEAFGVLGVYAGGKSRLDKIRGGALMSNERRMGLYHGFIEGNAAFRRGVFEAGCRFGDMTYGECIKLSSELAQRHMKTVWDPNLRVIHMGHLTYKRLFATDRTYARASLREGREGLVRGILKLLFLAALLIFLPSWPLASVALFIALLVFLLTYSLKDDMVAWKYRLRFLPILVTTRLSRLLSSVLETLLYLTGKGGAR